MYTCLTFMCTTKKDRKLITVLVLSVVVMCSCETFHIVPVNSIEKCEEEPCLNIDQLAIKLMKHNFSNLNLYFTPGRHYLNHYLSIINTETLAMNCSLHYYATVWLQGTNFSVIRVKAFAAVNIKFTSSKGFSSIGISVLANIYLSECIFEDVKLLLSSTGAIILDSVFEGGFTEISTNFLLTNTCKFNGTNIDILPQDTKVLFRAYINDTTFCGGEGFSIEQDSKDINIANCVFKENYQKGIHIWNATKIIIFNTNFMDHVSGGYLIILRSNYLVITNSTFTGNIDCASVITTGAKEVHIIYTLFADNECTAVHFDDTKPVNYKNDIDPAYINSSIFLNNRGVMGGGINTFASLNFKLFITNCEFTANYAHSLGGAIYSVDEFIILSSTFTSNAAGNGGAIYTNSYFMIVKCKFINNYNTVRKVSDEWTGAAIYIILRKHQKTPAIRNTKFTQNFGFGIVTVFRGKAQIDNTVFKNNGKLKVGTPVFNQNRGCIHLFNSRVDITGSVTLRDNIGDAIYAIQS